MRVGHDVVQCLNEVVDFLRPGDQRREQLDDVDVVGSHLRDDPVPVEQRYDDRLREHAGPQPLQGPEPAARRSRLRLPELDADHQAEPADVLDELVLLGQAAELGLQVSSGALGPADNVLVVEGCQRCQARYHCQLVAAEGRRVLERVLHRLVDASEDLLRSEHGADGHEAA